MKTAVTLHRRLPSPDGPPGTEDREAAWTRTARWAVTAVCAVMVVVAIGLAIGVQSELQEDRAELAAVAKPAGPEQAAGPALAAAAAVPQAQPSDEEVAKMWPRFRGPGGLGVSAYANVPQTWDGKSGKGIVWKTPVPLPGNNSPVVWGKHVFLSGADQRRREVYCFDAERGKLLWQQVVPGTPQSTAQTPKVNEDTGYAASTTATDGLRIFAIFANGDLARGIFPASWPGRRAWDCRRTATDTPPPWPRIRICCSCSSIKGRHGRRSRNCWPSTRPRARSFGRSLGPCPIPGHRRS